MNKKELENIISLANIEFKNENNDLKLRAAYLELSIAASKILITLEKK